MKKIINTSILAMAMLGLTSLANATTIVPLVTAESGIITDLNLSITYSGSYPQDFDIALEHNGTQVHVYDATTDFSGLFDAVFDDESLNGPAPKDADVLGDYVPDELLSAFDGMDLAGTWNLILWDDICMCGDDTVLTAWSIFGATVGAQFNISGPADILVDPESVPEPGSLALLGMGLLGFGVARRKQNK